MKPLEENNDFLKSRETHQPLKTEVKKVNQPPQKSTSNQVGKESKKNTTKSSGKKNWESQWKQTLTLPVSKEKQEYINKKHQRVMLVTTRAANTSFGSEHDEYNALSDYHKVTLVADNYWRVLEGQTFIAVPITDTHFWYNFDERCVGLAKPYQENKKRDKEDLLKLEMARPKVEVAAPVLEPVKSEPVKEKVVEQVVKSVHEIADKVIQFTSTKIKVSDDIESMCSTYLKSNKLGNRGVEDGDSIQQLTG